MSSRRTVSKLADVSLRSNGFVLRSRTMVRTLRFAAILIAALALCTWLGVVVVRNTTRAWFERDLESLAKLVLSGVRPSLIANWDAEHNADLRKILMDITR